MLRLLSPTGQSCAPPIKVVAVSVTSCTTSFGNTIDRVIALNLSDGGFRWKFATGTLNQDCSLPASPRWSSLVGASSTWDGTVLFMGWTEIPGDCRGSTILPDVPPPT